MMAACNDGVTTKAMNMTMDGDDNDSKDGQDKDTVMMDRQWMATQQCRWMGGWTCWTMEGKGNEIFIEMIDGN